MATAIRRWNGTAWIDILSTAYLRLTGDTMTGPIVYAFDPTDPNHLTRRSYVDTQIGTRLTPAAADAAYVNVVGDTMAGDLNMGNNRVVGLANPSADFHAAHKKYVDDLIATRLTPAAAEAAYVNTSGDIMTGPLKLPVADDVDLAVTNPPLMIGPASADNLVFDTNEIQARNNGVAAGLQLQPYGGSLFMGAGLTGMTPDNSLSWWFTTGPRLKLYPGLAPNGPYEIGMQPSGMYYRVGHAGATFNWYADGDYVDAANDPGTATGGERLMSLTGAGKFTLHGALAGEAMQINTGTSGYLGWWEGTTRRGYIGHYPAGHTSIVADTGNMYVDANSTVSGHGYVILGSKTNITGALSVSGAASVSGTLAVSGTTTFTGAVTLSEPVAMPLKIIGAGTSGYIGFYEGSTRRAYVGHFPNNALSCVADTGTATFAAAANDTYVGGSSGAASHTWLRAGSGQIMFMHGGTERGRMNDANFCWSQSTAGANNVGWFGTPTYFLTNNNDPSVPALIVNKTTGAAAGDHVVHFRWQNATRGTITHQGGTGGVIYGSNSDYRLKDDRGEISDGVTRVKQLRPLRVHWKDQPDDVVVDGFFAHEVAEVVPEAVTGEKDAVAGTEEEELDGNGLSEGDIIVQQLDAKALIPVLVAAVKELAGRVEALEV